MDIVTAAEIINSLNEASYPIPSTAGGLNELKCKAEEELENGTLKTGIALRTDSGALKIAIRRKTEGGGRAGAASRHTCSIKHFCDGDSSGTPIWIPRNSYYNAKKRKGEKSLLDQLKAVKRLPHGDAIFRFVCDNQALLVAIWDSPTDKIENLLYAMLMDRIVSRDYYNAKSITAPKTDDELIRDRMEIENYLRKNI